MGERVGLHLRGKDATGLRPGGKLRRQERAASKSFQRCTLVQNWQRNIFSPIDRGGGEDIVGHYLGIITRIQRADD